MHTGVGIKHLQLYDVHKEKPSNKNDDLVFAKVFGDWLFWVWGGAGGWGNESYARKASNRWTHKAYTVCAMWPDKYIKWRLKEGYGLPAAIEMLPTSRLKRVAVPESTCRLGSKQKAEIKIIGRAKL